MGFAKQKAFMCVVHNSVGSALLVLTVDGHTRASMRGTGDSTVPTLFYFIDHSLGGWVQILLLL